MQKLKTHNSMAAAAGFLGVPVSVLQQAKERGADGFDQQGRVDLGKLLVWLLTKGRDFEPDITLDAARAELLREKTVELKRRAAESAGTVSSTAEIKRALELLAWALTVSAKNVAAELAVRLAPDNPTRIIDPLAQALQQSVVSTAAGIARNLSLPAWATDALRKGAEVGLKNDGGDWFRSVGRLVSEEYAVAQAAYDARLKAEAAWAAKCVAAVSGVKK